MWALNDSGLAPSEIPPPAKDLPIGTDSPSPKLKNQRRPLQLRSSCPWLCHYCIHAFCSEVYVHVPLSPPRQWITNVIVPLPKERGPFRDDKLPWHISHVYSSKDLQQNLLNRIGHHVDPQLLKSNQAGFRPGRKCVGLQRIHTPGIMEGFRFKGVLHPRPVFGLFLHFFSKTTTHW